MNVPSSRLGLVRRGRTKLYAFISCVRVFPSVALELHVECGKETLCLDIHNIINTEVKRIDLLVIFVV